MAKRSIAVAGHRTSVSLEEPFWRGLAEIAALRGVSIAGLVAEVDQARPARSNLSSALRVYVLDWYRSGAASRPAAGRAAAAEPAS